LRLWSELHNDLEDDLRRQDVRVSHHLWCLRGNGINTHGTWKDDVVVKKRMVVLEELEEYQGGDIDKILRG
jgi:hypothetical protein